MEKTPHELRTLHELKGEALKSKIEELLRSTKRDGIEGVIGYLEKYDYFTAPASTRFHGNHEGGLAEHSYNVYLLLKKKNEDYNLGLPEASIIICGLLHDICKVAFYQVSTKNVKKETGWCQEPYYTVDDRYPLGHGAKSLSELQDFLKLSRQEKYLVRWHMGPYGCEGDSRYDFEAAVNAEPAVAAMYTADMEASNIFEETASSK